LLIAPCPQFGKQTLLQQRKSNAIQIRQPTLRAEKGAPSGIFLFIYYATKKGKAPPFLGYGYHGAKGDRLRDRHDVRTSDLTSSCMGDWLRDWFLVKRFVAPAKGIGSRGGISPAARAGSSDCVSPGGAISILKITRHGKKSFTRHLNWKISPERAGPLSWIDIGLASRWSKVKPRLRSRLARALYCAINNHFSSAQRTGSGPSQAWHIINSGPEGTLQGYAFLGRRFSELSAGPNPNFQSSFRRSTVAIDRHPSQDRHAPSLPPGLSLTIIHHLAAIEANRNRRTPNDSSLWDRIGISNCVAYPTSAIQASRLSKGWFGLYPPLPPPFADRLPTGWMSRPAFCQTVGQNVFGELKYRSRATRQPLPALRSAWTRRADDIRGQAPAQFVEPGRSGESIPAASTIVQRVQRTSDAIATGQTV